MRLRSRISSILAAGAILGATLVGFSAPSASAAGVCDLPNLPANNSNGVGHFFDKATLRAQPYSDCGSMGTYSVRTKFDVWCWKINAYGNPWVYVRIAGTELKGWLYTGHFVLDSGSVKDCPI